jgi:predicted RND superfamily exporter protein
MSMVKHLPDSDILKLVFDKTNKEMSLSNLTLIKQSLKRENYNWLKTMRANQYEFVNQYRQRISEIEYLQIKHYGIVESERELTPVKQASLAELHKLSITLSNLYDIAPYVIGNATIPESSEDQTASSESKPEAISYVV